MQKFGKFVRETRERLQKKDKCYSLRQVSARIGVGPSYLSKIERGEAVRLSEEKIIALAYELQLNPDHLLALGGKISDDVQKIIKNRPELFTRIVRGMKDIPDEVIEEKNDHTEITAILSRLHEIASIGAFHFAEKEGRSFWTSQVPTILGLPRNAPASLKTVTDILFSDSETDTATSSPPAFPEESASFRFERTIHTPDGQDRVIQVWTCVEAPAETGEKTYLGIMQDVTESARLRNDIDSARELLQLEVNEKQGRISTAIENLNQEIDNRKELEKDLYRLNRHIAQEAQSQKRFFKEHTYQLRSLISRIVSDSDGRAPIKGDALLNALNRILPKIDDLGDFISRTEGLAVEREPMDIRSMLEDIVEMFKEEAATKGVTLIHSVAPDIPAHTMGDKRRIRQILTAVMELFTRNAEWGNIQLIATVDMRQPSKLLVSLSTPSTMHRIYREMFFPEQKEQARAKQPNPVQMVGPLLDVLSGEFALTSQTGTDIAITLHIPISLAPVKVSPPAGKDASEMIALIVEDDPYNLIYVEKILQDVGVQTESAKTGADAIKFLNEKRFDILLLDIQLPDMDGVAIAKAIRNDPKAINQSIPIIAITAHGSPNERNKFINSGINKVIVKPFDKDVLLTEIAGLTLSSHEASIE